MTIQIMSKVHLTIFNISHLEILVKHIKISDSSEEEESLSSNSETGKQHFNKCQGQKHYQRHYCTQAINILKKKATVITVTALFARRTRTLVYFKISRGGEIILCIYF